MKHGSISFVLLHYPRRCPYHTVGRSEFFHRFHKAPSSAAQPHKCSHNFMTRFVSEKEPVVVKSLLYSLPCASCSTKRSIPENRTERRFNNPMEANGMKLLSPDIHQLCHCYWKGAQHQRPPETGGRRGDTEEEIQETGEEIRETGEKIRETGEEIRETGLQLLLSCSYCYFTHSFRATLDQRADTSPHIFHFFTIFHNLIHTHQHHHHHLYHHHPYHPYHHHH